MDGIIVPEHFIQATRDAGYRSLASALAELIDNALDAGASNVEIRIAEERRDQRREITVGVLDDGCGMSAGTLRNALRFGGSERFNRRATLGRYGMGLPNSSVSQAPRVDVFTWTAGKFPLRAYLDVEEVASRQQVGVGAPKRAALPDWVMERPDSGTLVQWSRCDRLRFKKASTLERKIREPLARMYRLPLADRVSIRLNGEPLKPLDPLFRVSVPSLRGTSDPYGDPLEYRVKVPSGGTSTVTVQFVELPVHRWHDLPSATKRALGIVGTAGMSVLRGSREIDYGWHLFGKKRRENYDDWWRCELRFEPELDELFGISHNKQGINPSPELRCILEPDLERIARELNARARKAFREARPPAPRPAVRLASKRDRLLPGLQASESGPRRATSGYRYRIKFHEEACPEFFHTEVRDSTVQLSINRNHPFYQKLYVQASSGSHDLDLLLLSAGRALLDLSEQTRRTLLRSWSDNLLAYLGR